MTPSAAAPIRLALEGRRPLRPPKRSRRSIACIERAVREILLAAGEDPKREGLRDTLRRVARAYRDLPSGLGDDPARAPGRVFEHESSGDDPGDRARIEFASMRAPPAAVPRPCARRLPARSRARGRLSKIARAVEVLARRPQLQERLAAQIADSIAGSPGARGVAVMVESEHLCMKIRGVGKHADMVTTAVRGELARNALQAPRRTR